MNSIRRQLLAWIVPGQLIALAAGGYAVHAFALHNLRGQFDDALLARARTFASLVILEAPDPEDEGHEADGGVVFDYKGSLAETDLGLWLRIAQEPGDGAAEAEEPVEPEDADEPGTGGDNNTSGENAEAEDDDGGGALAISAGWPAEPGAPSVSEGETHAFETVRIEGAPARLLVLRTFAALEPPDEPGAPSPGLSEVPIVVELAARLDAVNRASASVGAALAAGGVVAALGAAGAVAWGVHAGLRSLRRLSAALHRVRPGEEHAWESTRSYPSELHPVVGAIDSLLDRLEQAVERERRFTDAAAHELRTPIAELRASADVALRWPQESRLHRAVRDSHQISIELESLLDGLLEMSRGRNGAALGRDDRVALLESARAVLQPHEQSLRSRGVSFAFEGDGNARWQGPRGVIVAILRNLADNASEYTPDGGRIVVRVEGDESAGFVEYCNGPVSLAPNEAARIFEPFWRADESRTDRRHRGLGLAIVASLSDGLGLQCKATVSADRTLSIRIGPRAATSRAVHAHDAASA